MKIGILTFHRACNYGAVLQCYAMQETLKALGHEVEVVDYRAYNIEKTYKLIKTYNGIKTFVRSLLTMRFSYNQSKNFKSFRDIYLDVSKISYPTAESLKDTDYDCFVIGSDQVWSQRINCGYDPVYWGAFCPTSRKISYAASMGGHQPLNNDEIELINKYIDAFHASSVREDVLRDELNGLLRNKKTTLVLDPTLIAPVSVYEKILVKPTESNYVLYYQQGHHPYTKEIVANVANQLGCNVIVVAGEKEKYSVPYLFYNQADLSIPEFLGLFKYARFVFASSFHGTAFSIVFEKDFYYVGNARIERSKSLLNQLGLFDRMIFSDKLVDPSAVDYDSIRERKDELIKESLSFLKKAIVKI